MWADVSGNDGRFTLQEPNAPNSGTRTVLQRVVLNRCLFDTFSVRGNGNCSIDTSRNHTGMHDLFAGAKLDTGYTACAAPLWPDLPRRGSKKSPAGGDHHRFVVAAGKPGTDHGVAVS